MRNNPKLARYNTGQKINPLSLLSAIAGASAGAPAMANQALTADAMALPAAPMPEGFEGPVNAPTPYTGPQQYYAPNGQIVEAPFSDTRSWFDKARGVPDRAGEGNFQIQSQVAQQRAIAPLELANAQDSMRALAKVKQELHPGELAMQNASAEAKSMQEREAAKLALAQNQALGTAATPNMGFNSKNPSDVDFNYIGNPSEILDQPFIPYGEGVGMNQKYAQQNTTNKISEQAYADRPILNPLSIGDGSGSPYNNRFLNTTPGGIDANSRIASNQLAQKQIESQIAARNEPKIMEVGGNVIAISPDGTVKLLASGNAGKVVGGFDMTTGKPTSSVIGQSFQNYNPKPVANVYRGAGVQQPLEIDGGQIAQKYSGQRQNYVVGDNNTQTQTSQGAAPRTPPPRITQLEGSIPDYLRQKGKEITTLYDAFGQVIEDKKLESRKQWEENQKRMREKLAPYIRIAPSK
jgi:hypothetical protein